MASHYLTEKSQPAIATADLFDLLRPYLPEVPERIERLVAERTGIEWTAYKQREVVGSARGGIVPDPNKPKPFTVGGHLREYDVTAPATDQAKQWDGWGTALKPAHEPIVVARKPLSGTVAQNVLEWGTGGLNIDGCRVGTDETITNHSRSAEAAISKGKYGDSSAQTTHQTLGQVSGRWPANVVFDVAAGEALDQQSGERPAGTFPSERGQSVATKFASGRQPGDQPAHRLTDKGGASRFFTQADFGPDDWPFVYQAKPGKKERNAGLDGLTAKFAPTMGNGIGAKEHNPDTATRKQNTHPTVKPVALMRHLVRLVTPPGGTVLDPFTGSGTTLVAAVLEGFNAVGCEMTDEYLPIIQGRVEWARQQAARVAEEADRQQKLFDV
jgi:site-specific DNA-methyltransferase (adenine-specific)